MNAIAKMWKSNPFRAIFMCADSIDMLLVVLGLFGSMGDGLTTPVLILFTSQVMNNFGAGPGSDPRAFRRAITQDALLFLYSAGGNFIACFLEGYCWTRTGERQASRMRHRYLKAVLRQDVGYFDLKGTSTSEMVKSVSNDTLVIQDVIAEKVPNFLMNLFLALGCYMTALLLMWRYAIVALPLALLLIIQGVVYGRVLMGLSRRVRDENNKAGSIVEQAVSSIRTVYSFVGETKTMNDFSAALEGSVMLGLKQGLAKGVVIGSNGVTYAVWAFMAWYSGRLITHFNGKGGTVFAVGISICRGGLSFGDALSSIKNLSEACSAGERIMEVMKRVPKIDTDNMEGEILANVSGEVEFQSIEFAYPSRPDILVLQNFNMIVPAGKMVALVGGSGSGKSTVIALLQRFYDPIGGQILLDGVPINKLQLKWFRSQMGLVSQEPALFATSIRNNINFGKDDATFEEVTAAAKASNAHRFIEQLPQGYDTQVGERGIQMSGGQKQRIAIARAIIREPQILLLDEATSALDSESESIVQEALNNASLGRTTIVIAHRLSTTRNADGIIVVQNGQVIESGSNDELILYDEGLYSSFVRQQQIQKTPEEKESTMLPCSSSHITNIDHNQASQRIGQVSGSSLENSLSARSNSSMEENIKKDVPAPTCRRLLLLNILERKKVCMGCTSATLSGAVQPIHSLILGSMVSVYFLTDHAKIQSKIEIYSLSFLGLAFFSMVINISQHYNFASLSENLTKRIREQMLSKILTFEVGWYDQKENSSGAICSRLTRDASVVKALAGDQMSLLVQTISSLILSVTLGLIIAWRLAIVMIAVQPLIIICLYVRMALLKRVSAKAIASQDESSKLASEAVSNLRTVAAFSSQKQILKMLDRTQIAPRRENIRQSWYAGLGLGFSRSIASCTWALHFWYGGKLISQNYITAKDFFITFLVLVNTGRVIADVGSSTTDLAKGTDAVKSVFEVLDRDTRINSKTPEGYRPQKLNGHIELVDVHFAYPARPNVIIFERFSLNIEAGVSTALVGQSGSGKSTIISLIERFYDPLNGMVIIDGRDVRSYHLRSLRKQMALVSQEPTLFSGTIRENIEYGVSNKVDETEVVNAARVANAHNFIAGLRDGYDTWCGDRGMQLSGGQKQRIAIARAILKNPTILLLDEATSALDSQSEKEVQEALDRMMVGRTSVVVAHRLNTIQNCDTIAVLDKGEVVEKGSHSSLLAMGPNGAYNRLVSIQQQKPSTHQTV